MKIKSPIGFQALWSAFLAVGTRVGRLSLTSHPQRCVSIAFDAACGSLGGVKAEAQLKAVPPEITRPTYAMVDEAFFESKFGTSFTNGDLTPLVVGKPDSTGKHPLQRIDISSGELVLHDVGSIRPSRFTFVPALTATVRNMEDFINLDPNLISVNFSISTRAHSVTAAVVTSSQEELRLQGTWMTVAVSSHECRYSSTTTVFIAEAVELQAGNEVLTPPSENIYDFLYEVDCVGLSLSAEDCESLQRCLNNYATCMANAGTVYIRTFNECGSWASTLKGIGAGAIGGCGLGAGIGCAVPGVGTLLGGGIGVVVGGFTYGLSSHWYCVRAARITYETEVAKCANLLRGCLLPGSVDP